MEHLKIKNWAEHDRPREKLSKLGPEALSTSELIAILLRSGTKSSTAVDLARQILAYADNNLTELGKLSVSDLSKVKGCGPVKAVTLVAALELGRRRGGYESQQKIQVVSSKDVVKVIQDQLSDLHHEEFWIFLLNKANRIIEKKCISKGGMSGTVVDPKIVFQEALKSKASAIILCHNHPSGNTTPSQADIQITKKIKEAGKTLEISVLDHIIIAGSSFYSFADEGIF